MVCKRWSVFPLILVGMVASIGCSSIVVVRVPNGTDGGQPGAPLAPVTIPPCKVLDSEQRGACVYTVNDCPNGIGVVRSERKHRDTVVTLQCFVPNAVDNGDDEGGDEGL